MGSAVPPCNVSVHQVRPPCAPVCCDHVCDPRGCVCCGVASLGWMQRWVWMQPPVVQLWWTASVSCGRGMSRSSRPATVVSCTWRHLPTHPAHHTRRLTGACLLRLSMPAYACLCLPMPAYACLCLPMPAYACLCLPLPTASVQLPPRRRLIVRASGGGVRPTTGDAGRRGIPHSGIRPRLQCRTGWWWLGSGTQPPPEDRRQGVSAPPPCAACHVRGCLLVLRAVLARCSPIVCPHVVC